ncbi:hypothetical protein ACF07V_04630 [Streptomyces sp. NPDC015661]|uniref:hypothetical protein n=1 Tax=Streptomyces sp. NPDC015661 TaxID=3364961 RepID=UPI0036F8CA0A
MPTPRHHLNRQRRRQALADQSAPASRPRSAVALLPEPEPEPRPAPKSGPKPKPKANPEAADGRRARPLAPLVVLCVLTLLLGGFAGWAHSRTGELRADPARGNTALTDLARTSEIKGQTAAAVAALFSYDHADTGPFERAGKTLLTGKAVAQHRTLFGGVLAQAAQQKTVITTTVTDSAVERIDGDRARVLVYADQSSVSTAGTVRTGGGKQKPKAQDQGVYAGAMFAVDVVRRDGRWLVENIDTFGR